MSEADVDRYRQKLRALRGEPEPPKPQHPYIWEDLEIPGYLRRLAGEPHEMIIEGED